VSVGNVYDIDPNNALTDKRALLADPDARVPDPERETRDRPDEEMTRAPTA